MFTKYMTAGLVGSALLATAAFAQTPSTTSPSSTPPAAASSNSSFQGDWRASKVVGLSVYNDNNESIGTINDILIDKSGNAKAAVIGVGGFLGVGEHLVAVPFDKVKFVNEPVAYTGTASTKPGSSTNPSTTPPTTTGSSSTSSTSTSKSNPWYPDHAVFSATKDQLKAMPEFKYST
jgi:sporulation protein YlmC with PRC-barrel domain